MIEVLPMQIDLLFTRIIAIVITRCCCLGNFSNEVIQVYTSTTCCFLFLLIHFFLLLVAILLLDGISLRIFLSLSETITVNDSIILIII